MKKLAIIMAIGCAAALAPPSVMANSYKDYDSYFNVGLGTGTLVDSTHPLSGIFDWRTGGDPGDTSLPSPINDVLGYNPATEVVTGISLAIQLDAAGAGAQTIVVDLDGVSITLLPPFVGSVTFGGTLAPSEVASLIAAAQDGRVNLTISAQGSSAATANYGQFGITTGSRGVPEGGSSLALLGFAICGLGWAKRKFRA